MTVAAMLPSKHGYVLVVPPEALREKGPLVIHSPVRLPGDVRAQALGLFLQDIADYLFEVSFFQKTGLIALLWALASCLSLAVSSLWNYGAELIIMYGWIKLWFFADGIWHLSRWLAHTGHRRTARALRWVKENPSVEVIVKPDWPRAEKDIEMDEAAYLEKMATEWPHLAPYYDHMLTKRAPWVMQTEPLKIMPRLRNAALGKPIDPPVCIYYLGGLR